MISKKKIITIFALSTLCLSASALSNQECVEVYRGGYLDLRDSIVDFNNKQLDKTSFAAEVTGISASVRTLRAACYFTESPDVGECVDSYKGIYNDLRDRVRVRAVISGNQDYINFSEGVSTEEPSTGISGFFGRLRNAGADTVKRSQIAIIDAKCK